MTDTDAHYCSACGQQHGGPDANAEVEIARIMAHRDVEVAKIERGEAKTVAEVAAETEIAVTELETAAAVEVAAETDAPAAEPEEPETTTILVDGPEAEPAEEAPSMEPAEDSHSEPPEPRRSRGYWP